MTENLLLPQKLKIQVKKYLKPLPIYLMVNLMIYFLKYLVISEKKIEILFRPL